MNTVAKIKPEEAIPLSISARMVAIMREVGAIGKDKVNDAQKFKYRGIDDVYNALNPLMAKHGVFMSASVLGKTREERTNKNGTVLAFTCLRMRYRFYGEDGSYLETEAEGEGMDSGDKSSNKAMAVAHKYALLQAFCIPTQETDDPDAQVHIVKVNGNGHKHPEPNGFPDQRSDAPEPDPDIRNGTQNWVEKQEAKILACTDVNQMTDWLNKYATYSGRTGSWERPTPGSDLDKLLKHFPDLFRRLKSYYLEKLREV